MMKIKSAIVLCINRTDTVCRNFKPLKGCFISASCQVGKIAGTTAVIPGFSVGMLFDNRASIDISYKRTATEKTPVGETDDRFYLDGQWIGIRCAYLIKQVKSVSLNIPFEVGAGELELDLKESYENNGVVVPGQNAWYLYIEPDVAIEINAGKYAKFGLAAGYRFTSDISFRNLKDGDLMGFTYSAELKIGLF
jgi:hypothetical protein